MVKARCSECPTIAGSIDRGQCTDTPAVVSAVTVVATEETRSREMVVLDVSVRFRTLNLINENSFMLLPFYSSILLFRSGIKEFFNSSK